MADKHGILIRGGGSAGVETAAAINDFLPAAEALSPETKMLRIIPG